MIRDHTGDIHRCEKPNQFIGDMTEISHSSKKDTTH